MKVNDGGRRYLHGTNFVLGWSFNSQDLEPSLGLARADPDPASVPSSYYFTPHQPPHIFKTQQSSTSLSSNILAMPLDNNNQNPVTFVTSTLGNGVGGVAKTAGGIVGAGGRGVGQTITGVTGNAGKPLGDAVEALGNGIEGGTKNVAEGVENAGKGKKDFWR